MCRLRLKLIDIILILNTSNMPPRSPLCLEVIRHYHKIYALGFIPMKQLLYGKIKLLGILVSHE